MNEEKFNMEMRKFLKKVGITSQRLIEQHVRDAVAKGTIDATAPLAVRATLFIDELGVEESIDGQIVLE
jgi:hypothetical protein